MAGERFLLSGDQLATYQSWSASFPPPTYQTNLTLSGINALGSDADRFFLVRSQGSGDPVQNGDLFTIYRAIDDGSGGLEPNLAQPLFQGATATPDAYQSSGGNGLGAGDTYLALGLFNGPRILVNLDGVAGQTTFSVTTGGDVTGDDGSLSLAELNAGNPDQIICFAEGTPITTRAGDVRIEHLRVGDCVLTYEHGYQPIRWIGSTTVTLTSLTDDLVPIRIAPHTMGPGQPACAITLSPAHRILWTGARAELLFGEAEVLVAAKHLVNGTTIRRDTSRSTVTYWHFLCDTHEVVFSAGLKSESFFPASYGIGTLARDTRQELLRLFPSLADLHPVQTARPVLRRYESRLLDVMSGGQV